MDDKIVTNSQNKNNFPPKFLSWVDLFKKPNPEKTEDNEKQECQYEILEKHPLTYI